MSAAAAGTAGRPGVGDGIAVRTGRRTSVSAAAAGTAGRPGVGIGITIAGMRARARTRPSVGICGCDKG
jgi:hypothetical protein